MLCPDRKRFEDAARSASEALVREMERTAAEIEVASASASMPKSVDAS